jgi:geranylgeranyl diphosphate synthase type II
MGANLFSDDVSQALSPALGVEVFHNFTLLHDDLMDNSSKRRGKDTVHIRWDANTAILSGDAMSILAGKLVSDVNQEVLVDIMNCYNQTALEVCEGQMLDMNFEEREEVEAGEYLKMITLKTSVLIAASLKIGALSCGARPDQADELYNFGLNLGIAFQLQDDYLDTFGDEKLFGKPVGNDIVNNKKTYLMITCLKESEGKDREELLSWIKAVDFDRDKKVEGVKAIYRKYHIEEKTLSLIDNFFDRASASLEGIAVERDRKSILREFSASLMRRKH